MNKRIVWSIILVPFLVIGLLFTVSCAGQTPRMTAAEVCQYVNQALPNEYVYQSSTARLEFRYIVQEAVNPHKEKIETEPRLPKGTWIITVKVVVEYQMLKEGQWVGVRSTDFQTKFYYFNENTGAVTEVK